MRLNLPKLASFGVVIAMTLQVQSQCTINVTIQEGSSIEMCENAKLPISGSSGFVSYDWTGPETLSGASVIPNFSGQYILSAVDAVSCTSLDTIDVIINPTSTDVILSSEGNPICPGIGTTLSLSGSNSSLMWGGGEVTPTIQATSAGIYSVSYVDPKGCDGFVSIDLIEVNFALTSNAGTICSGGAATLEASGGSSYVWTTGETDSTIVVSPTQTTVYTVTITEGSCSATFSQTITPVEIPERVTSSVIYVSPNTPQYIYGPTDFVSYTWYPTNQLNNSTSSGVIFSGTESQYILVDAVHASGCLVTDTFLVIVVELTIPTGFSPNGDNRNDAFYIPELSDLDAAVSVWNRWGDQVLDSDHYQNNWRGTCETSFCLGNRDLPEGTYFYRIDVHGITFKGYLTLKR